MISSAHKTLILSAEDVQSIIKHYGMDVIMDRLIESIEKEIIKYDPQKIQIPARSGFNYKVPNVGLVEWMPLYESGDKVTIKIVGYHPRNPRDFNLPTILSSISQYDSKTGHLMGIVDGVLLTALRTGAASALASKYLAKNQSKTLGLIGCGAQAITQLHAISRIFDLEKVIFYDIDKETEESFKYRAECLNLKASFEKYTIKKIVSESDIICTATSIEVNEGPLFENFNVQPHIHINAVGSDFPGKVEIPMDIVDQAFICPDFIDQALIEGECQRIKRNRIDADLKGVASDPEAYSRFRDKITLFDSTGWALEDHVIMNDFIDYAKELNIGQELELEFIPEDSKNPYQFISEQVFAAK